MGKEKLDKTELVKLVYEEEPEGNLATARILHPVAGFYMIVSILAITGLIKAELQLAITLVVLAVLLLALCLVCRKLEGKGHWMKYVLEVFFLCTILIVNILTGNKAWMLYALPIMFSYRYYNKRFTIFVGAFAILLMVCSAFVSQLFNQQQILVNTLLVYTLPNALIIIMLVAGCLGNIRKTQRIMMDLRAARDEAQQANEAKTAFLFNMSHDIRTPMNAILGFSEVLDEELDTPALAQEHLAKIKMSGEYMLTLINNVLEVARIDSGKESPDESFVDLMDDKCNVVPMLEGELEAKNLVFTSDMNITHRYVYTDMAKVREITMNLLSNAIKYTPKGGSIHMQFDEVPCSREGYAAFVNCITDTGIGMSKEFQNQIFDSFSRERNSTQSGINGTGLGMAIVKRLVDLMGGTIEVESEIGKGTTFRVRLEHRIVENPEEYIEKQQEVICVERMDLTGRRILLAEDNELNAEVAMIILQEVGATVDLTNDGVECVNAMLEKPAGYYDLILMDIQMPNLDGYDATRKIRLFSNSVKANIPIIAMTANAFEEDRKKALDVGMNAHLAKPIDITKLMEVVSQAIGVEPKPIVTRPSSNSVRHIKRVLADLQRNPILSVMPGGFFAYEAGDDERLIFANQAACEIWGCDSFEELIELSKGSFRGMMHPEDYERITTSIWEQVNESENRDDHVEYRIIRKDGTVCKVSDYGHLEVNKRFCDIFYVFVTELTEENEGGGAGWIKS